MKYTIFYVFGGRLRGVWSGPDNIVYFSGELEFAERFLGPDGTQLRIFHESRSPMAKSAFAKLLGLNRHFFCFSCLGVGRIRGRDTIIFLHSFII